ncbi:MAG: sensor histidine kinase [Thermomicrobiales bacterium]
MGTPTRSGQNPWPHRLSYLKFLLIWPLYEAFRRKCARSLRWRLASSHLATVFLSVIAASIAGALVLVTVSYFNDPRSREPSAEAREVANVLQELNAKKQLTPEETSAILLGMSEGDLGPNRFTRDINFWSTIGREFDNISSISIVDATETIVASSASELIGQAVLLASPAAPGVAQRALAGSTDVVKNSVIRPKSSVITGAYPLSDDDGNIVGAVVVDKADRSFPAGLDWALLTLNYVGQIGLTAALILGIPAIPVAAIIGIRRANTISQPVRELAEATQEFSRGELDARVPIRSQDEIGALEMNFNNMADQLEGSIAEDAELRQRAEDLLAANRDLIANVSHELRTPVSLIRGHIEALQTDPSQVEEYSRIALRETDRLERLVEDLFQLTRLESQRIELHLEDVDAGSVVREAIESLAGPAHRDAGLTLSAQIQDGPLLCRCDRQRLVQVLQNLIRNAIRFTPRGGIIVGTAERVDGAIAVSVHDTGVGIPPDAIPNIFQRFFRAEQSRSRGAGGSGLGLAIAKELVEAMGGTISAESVVDEGSTFTITLPAAPVNDETRAQELASATTHST